MDPLTATALVMGIGASGIGIAQAFSSKGSEGISEKIPMSKKGDAFQAKAFKTIQKQYNQTNGLMPANLASIFIGNFKKQAQGSDRAARGAIGQLRTGEPTTGMQMAGIFASPQEQAASYGGAGNWLAGMRKEQRENALAGFENIRNVDLQTPIFRAQASGYKQLGVAQNQAERGAAIGSLFNVGGMYGYAKYRS